jgi:hypothetical protein
MACLGVSVTVAGRLVKEMHSQGNGEVNERSDGGGTKAAFFLSCSQSCATEHGRGRRRVSIGQGGEHKWAEAATRAGECSIVSFPEAQALHSGVGVPSWAAGSSWERKRENRPRGAARVRRRSVHEGAMDA